MSEAERTSDQQVENRDEIGLSVYSVNQDGVLATINNAKRHYRPEPTTSSASASASATAYTSNVIPSTAVPLSGSSSLIGSAALFVCFC